MPVNARGVGLAVFALVAPFGLDNVWKLWFVLAAGAVLVFADYRGRTPLDFPLALFFGGVLISTLLSLSPAWSFLPHRERADGVIIWLVYGLAALQAARLSLGEGRLLLRGLVLMGAVQSLLAVGQSLNAIPPLSQNAMAYLGHGYGTLGNVMFFSGSMAALAPIAMTTGLPGSAIAMLSGLFAANERVVWLGVAAALALLIARGALSRWWTLAFLGALPLLATRRILEAGLPWHDFLPRLDVWRQVAALVWQRPWGWGLNTLALVNPVDRTIYDNPHNELLYVAFSFGLPALVCYLWIWWTSLRRLWENTSREALGVFCGLVAFGIWSLTNWSHIGAANVLWTLLGLSVPLGGRDGPADGLVA